MSRKAINTLLTCLLCLLPALSFSQSLQRLEYWFDSDFSSRKSITLSGTEATVNKSLSTDGLDNGIHKFSFRIRRTDGKYSAITTTLFFKQNDTVGEVLEYWLDDDYEHRVTMTLSGTTDEQELTFDLREASIGFHKLNFRVAGGGKGMSATYTTGILKMPLGTASQVEYWFDNDQANSKVLDGHLSSDGKSYIINTDIDANQLSVGMHRLSYRACDSENHFYGAVQTVPILKAPSGKSSILEYWIDNDRKNARQFSGTATTDGYNFIRDLDLAGIAPGHHRLYCRSKSSDGKLVSAVTSMPIIVKSKYNIDAANVKMKSFTVAVDNEEPVTINVDRNEELILNPYTLNVSDLSTGNHTLKAHFWNTANAGVALEQTFRVNSIEPPTITLTAQEKDGQVTLKFNSIPNDVKWALARTDANGASAKIDGKEESRYPSEITVVDNPPAGSYKYKARGYYMDADGTRKAVNSNEVEVAVVASENGPFGKISGDVRVGGVPLWGETWTVTFSDGNTVTSDKNGNFYRDKIPVGTKLTVTAESRDYKCDTVSVTIKEGYNGVYLKGRMDEVLVRSRYNSDLEFDSYVEFEPRLHMKFKVRNINRLPWSGKIRIVTGRKEYMDNPPKNPLEDPNWTPVTQQLAGSVAPITVTDNIQYDYTDNEIYLSPGESKDVYIKHHIPLTTPPSYKDELYYFFVESVDEYGTKLVAVNDEYNIKENPLVQLVNNGQYDAEKQGEEYVESCIALVMGLCSTVTEFDGKLGDMSKCMEEMQQTLGYTLDYYLLADKIERATTYSQILDDIPEWHFYHILYQEDRRFLGMVNSVRDNIAKEVRACKNTLKYLKDVKKCIDMVKSYNQWQDMNELERTGAIAEKILDLADNKIPFASILKMYLDVTKKTIHNINGLAEKWYANHDYETFYNGYGEIYSGSNFAFDVRVKKKRWISSSFDAEDVKEHIYSVEINCVGHVATNDPFRCTATYTPEVEDGKLRLHRINISGDAPSSGGIVPIEDMWMTIRWSNGRVSHVPIRNSEEMQGNGVKHDKNHYTITFQSATNDIEHMADIIFLDD